MSPFSTFLNKVTKDAGEEHRWAVEKNRWLHQKEEEGIQVGENINYPFFPKAICSYDF